MATPVVYTVYLLTPATDALKEIKDRRIQSQIGNTLQRLQHNPEQQGKPLAGELAGYRSIRASGQRFRIIYRVDREAVEVLVVQVSLRKASDRDDVYALAKRWLQRGLLEP